MNRKLFATLALVCCFTVCLAMALADLNGKWVGSITIPSGEEVGITYNIKVDGDKLTGTGEANGNTLDIEEGKINGTDFSFKITNTDGSAIPHSGKYYAEGDSVGMDITLDGQKFHAKFKRGN